MWKFIFKISRPRFWLYLAGPFLIGFLAASSSNRDFLSWFFLVSLLYFLLAANIFLYGVNDLFDLKTDLLNPKKDKNEIRLTDLREQKIIKIYTFFFVSLSLLALLYIDNFKAQLFLLLFIVLSFFYSAPPIRFKSIPFLDSLSNILYILPGLFSYSYLSGNWPNWEIVLATWAWAVAMHLFSAIVDIDPDTQAGLKTGAIIMGEKISLFVCFFLWLFFAIILIKTQFLSFFAYFSLIYPLSIVYLLITKRKAINIYWYFPWLNAALGFISFWYLFLT